MSTIEEREFLQQVEQRLISVTTASQISQLTATHVRRLLSQGKLAGVRIDRIWYTTREAVHTYLETDRRPGPKTD